MAPSVGCWPHHDDDDEDDDEDDDHGILQRPARTCLSDFISVTKLRPDGQTHEAQSSETIWPKTSILKINGHFHAKLAIT